MDDRLSKIITRKGDDGSTSLDGKNRLSKSDPRIEAVGSLDELNSAIGIVLAHLPKSDHEIADVLLKIQNTLFDAGGELCPPYRSAISDVFVKHIEEIAKKWNKTLPPLKEFVLPSGSPAAAHCHLARAICRRAERMLVALHQLETLNPSLLRYLNRLSDLLFITARLLARENGSDEHCWQPHS